MTIASTISTISLFELTAEQASVVNNEVNRIVQNLKVNFTEEGLSVLRAYKREELILLHHGLGRHIRNTYGLWATECTTTKIWTEHGNLSGEHPCHPDNFSMLCVERLWETLQ
jgi:hypothetical protein